MFGEVCLHRGKLTIEHQIQQGISVSPSWSRLIHLLLPEVHNPENSSLCPIILFTGCLSGFKPRNSKLLSSLPFYLVARSAPHLCVSFGQSAGLGANGTKAKVKNTGRSLDVFTVCSQLANWF